MSVRCFDCHDQVANGLVVFAQSHGDALRIASQRLKSLSGRPSLDLTAIERKVGVGGLANDHLLAAIEAGVAGIGHLQSDDSWTVLPPGIRPLHSVRPPQMEMVHFIDDDGYEVVLFAINEFRAAELYDAIVVDYRRLPRHWRGSEWETWMSVGLVRHQGQAEMRGVEGVGVYNADAGWQILPLDYAALGAEPPLLP